MDRETLRSEAEDEVVAPQQAPRTPTGVTAIFERLRGLASSSKPDTRKIVDLHHQEMVAHMHGIGVTLI